MISNHSLLGKNLPITNPTIRTERLKPEDPRSRKIFTRRVMKDYCKQNVFKDKATLARKEKEFQKGTSGITSKAFLNTFTPKMVALHITTRKIKKGTSRSSENICRRAGLFSESSGIQGYHRILKTHCEKETRGPYQ